jgi:hypothetical protein
MNAGAGPCCTLPDARRSKGARQRSAIGKAQVGALGVLAALDAKLDAGVAEREGDEAILVGVAGNGAGPRHRIADVTRQGAVRVDQAFDTSVGGGVADGPERPRTIHVAKAVDALARRAVAERPACRSTFVVRRTAAAGHGRLVADGAHRWACGVRRTCGACRRDHIRSAITTGSRRHQREEGQHLRWSARRLGQR